MTCLSSLTKRHSEIKGISLDFEKTVAMGNSGIWDIIGDDIMTTVSVTTARKNIYQILSDVNSSSQPITITNDRGKNGVLISEDDWNAIQEMLYLNSVPDMAESIIKAGNEPPEECSIYNPDEEW